MEFHLFKQTVDNALPVAIATASGMTVVPGLDPIPTADIIAAYHDTYAAEVRQLVTVTLPTIVAGTTYGIQINNIAEVDEQWHKRTWPYRATLETLTGTAVDDQYFIAKNIAYKVNNDGKFRCQAGPKVTLTHGADTTAKYEIVTGDTSGAVGIVIVPAAASTSTTVMQIAPFNVEFVNGETLTGTVSGAIAALTAGPTHTADLYVLDDGAYFSQGTLNKGINTVIAGDNVPTANVATTDTGVYQFGTGTEMVKHTPIYDQYTGNVIQGNWNGAGDTKQGGEAFASATNYDRTIIVYTAQAPANATTQHPRRRVAQAVWYDTTDGNKAAWKATVDALVP